MHKRMMLKTSIILALGLSASMALARGNGAHGGGYGGRFGPEDGWWQSNSRWSKIHGDSANYPGYSRGGRDWDKHSNWPANWDSRFEGRGPYWDQY